MTHTTKHTPGPWVVDDEVSADEAGQETLGVYAEQGGYIAGIHCGPDTTIDEQDKANAHLIAAAPAMYEALSRLRNVASTASNHMRLSGNEEEALLFDNDQRVVEAALAQAEGRHHE